MNRKLILIMTTIIAIGAASAEHEGTRFITSHGYTGCIEISNATTRAVLEPNMGGRVISYQLNGVEALYQDPQADGIVHKPGDSIRRLPGGRFDIGPEKTLAPRPTLWVGRWEAEIKGERSARLTSQIDPGLGIQLVRDFVLAADSSHLRCTQTITNRGDVERRVFHWSRTFAAGGGISLSPLNPASRYPKGYLIYGPGAVIDLEPADEPNIRVRDGILEIIGPPSRPKFAIDASDGWLAYVTRNGLLFTKTFSIYPDRPYG